MKCIFIVVLIPIVFLAKAQQKETKGRIDDNKIYTAVEHEPEFPGGIGKFAIYLMNNIQLQKKEVKKEDFQGSFLFQMIIEKDGSISNGKRAQANPQFVYWKADNKSNKDFPKMATRISEWTSSKSSVFLPILFLTCCEYII
ncbi:MAG TPA: hypothetical protein VIM89_15175 [Mucilaginibacter sp.]